jgi:hypothetical protein
LLKPLVLANATATVLMKLVSVAASATIASRSGYTRSQNAFVSKAMGFEKP